MRGRHDFARWAASHYGLSERMAYLHRDASLQFDRLGFDRAMAVRAGLGKAVAISRRLKKCEDREVAFAFFHAALEVLPSEVKALPMPAPSRRVRRFSQRELARLSAACKILIAPHITP